MLSLPKMPEFIHQQHIFLIRQLERMHIDSILISKWLFPPCKQYNIMWAILATLPYFRSPFFNNQRWKIFFALRDPSADCFRFKRRSGTLILLSWNRMSVFYRSIDGPLIIPFPRICTKIDREIHRSSKDANDQWLDRAKPCCAIASRSISGRLSPSTKSRQLEFAAEDLPWKSQLESDFQLGTTLSGWPNCGNTKGTPPRIACNRLWEAWQGARAFVLRPVGFPPVFVNDWPSFHQRWLQVKRRFLGRVAIVIHCWTHQTGDQNPKLNQDQGSLDSVRSLVAGQSSSK